jgi:hypothetical protein
MQQRNSWLTYAAVMMFITAGLYVLWAVNLWADSAWVADVSNGILGDQGWLWGLFDAALAVVFVAAGKSLLDGRDFGRWFAVIAASIGIVRWFYWMAFTPFLSLTVLLMLFLVIYAVLVTWEAKPAQ